MDTPICRDCKKPLPAEERGWNRIRRCPLCRELALSRHALGFDVPTDDDEEDS